MPSEIHLIGGTWNFWNQELRNWDGEQKSSWSLKEPDLEILRSKVPKRNFWNFWQVNKKNPFLRPSIQKVPKRNFFGQKELGTYEPKF